MKKCNVCEKYFEDGMFVFQIEEGKEFLLCEKCRESVFHAIDDTKCWNCGNITKEEDRRLVVLREKLEMVCYTCHKRMYLDEYDKSREAFKKEFSHVLSL